MLFSIYKLSKLLYLNDDLPVIDNVENKPHYLGLGACSVISAINIVITNSYNCQLDVVHDQIKQLAVEATPDVLSFLQTVY